MTTYGDDGSLRRETDFAADLAATLGCIGLYSNSSSTLSIDM